MFHYFSQCVTKPVIATLFISKKEMIEWLNGDANAYMKPYKEDEQIKLQMTTDRNGNPMLSVDTYGFNNEQSSQPAESNTGSYIQFLKPKSALLRINENQNVIMLAIRSEESVWIANLENSTLRKTVLKEIRNHVKSMLPEQSLEIFELK